MKKPLDVIIIGGGLSGLSAGYFLSKKDKKVLILEKESWVGGRAHSIIKEGYTIDRGAMYLLFIGKNTKTCLDDLGLSKKVINVSKKFSFLKNDEVIEINFSKRNLIGTFIGSKLFNFESKINPQTYLFLIKCIIAFRNIKADYNNFERHNFSSGAEILCKYFSKKTVEEVFVPISETFLFANLKDVSSAIVMVLLGAILDPENKIKYVEGGFGEISNGLFNKIKDKKNKILTEEVSTIVKQKLFKITTKSGKIFFAKSVISSIPIPLLKDVFPNAILNHSHVLYSKIICDNIALTSPIEKIKDNHLIFLKAMSKSPIVLIGESTAKSKKSAPDGKGLLYVLLSPSISKKMFKFGQKKIEKVIDNELQKLFPEYLEKRKFHNVNVWSHAFTLTNREYFEKRGNETKINGFFICGDSVTVGLDGVMESGRIAAELSDSYLRSNNDLS